MQDAEYMAGRPIRILMCGSRDWIDVGRIRDRVAKFPASSIVITGGAHGADSMAETAARQRGLHVAVVKPLWDHYGKAAGFKRNEAMIHLGPDYVIAFQVNGSRGTQMTIDHAKMLQIPVEVNVMDPVPEGSL